MSKLTSKDVLRTKVYGANQYIPGDPSAQKLALGVSSGSQTGMPTIVIHHRENDIPENSVPHKWSAYGEENAVLRLAPSQQNVLQLVTEIWNLSKPARFLMATREDIESGYMQRIIEEFKPTQIDAQPSLLVHLLMQLQKQKAASTLSYLQEHIRAFAFSGEQMTKTQTDIINTCLPHATSFTDYSLSETPWWFACTCSAHPNPDTSITCVSPSFTDRVKIHEHNESRAGEILIWTRELGWYKTGDMGKLEEQNCACGSQKRLIVYGRQNYDIIPCVGAVFLTHEVDRVFETLKEYVADYLVEVTENVDEDMNVRGHVHLTVVPKEELNANPTAEVFLKNTFERQLFVTKTKVLAHLIKKDVFLPTTISFVEKIPRRGNKQIRLQRG